MQTDPTPEHAWLKQIVGEWTFENECSQGPDKEPLRGTGRESVRMLGDLWTIGEMEGEMPGCEGTMKAIMTIGFDPARGKFVGSWVGSPMTELFVYEGELDEARRVLTLNTTGPDFEDPSKTAEYRDIIELQDADTRVFRSEAKQPDGSYVEFLHGTFQRVK